MAISYDYVTPAELTGFVRNVPTPGQVQLERYLPNRYIGDIEAVINEVTRTNRATVFRAFDAETPIGKRDTWTRKRIGLPPLGQKTVITEEERIRLEALRTGGQNTTQIVDAIYDDARINTEAVLWRMELARGDVLTDGKFTLSGENGLTLEADFGIPGTHIVTAGTVWTTYASATPLADMRAWMQVYIDDNGEAPGRVLMSSKRVTDLTLNAEIRALAASNGYTASIVTPGTVAQLFSAYGLPPIETYDSQVDVGGSTTRIIPQDRVIFLPANASDLGYTAWGVTAEALELAGGQNPSLTFQQAPGLVGVVMKEGDPVRTWTKVGAVGMPVLTDPKRILVADVALMAARRLAANVWVQPDEGEAVMFGPDDVVPDWAAARITNPKAWETAPEPDPEPTVVAPAVDVAPADGPFDPGAHTVKDVLAYLESIADGDEGAAEYSRVIDAEAAGKARAGILRDEKSPEE